MPDPLPSAEAEPDRYEEQPLLLIVENYILDCLGEFDSAKHEGMATLVHQLFGGGETWQEAVREVMDLPDSFDEEVCSLWEKNQKIAEEAGEKIHPVQFAKLCADESFADLGDLVDDCDESPSDDDGMARTNSNEA